MRKRPLDEQRVLLCEDELIELSRQWGWANGYGTTFDAQLDRYVAKKNELEKLFGKPPSSGDVRWGLLNEDLLKFSAERNSVLVAFSARRALPAICGVADGAVSQKIQSTVRGNDVSETEAAGGIQTCVPAAG